MLFRKMRVGPFDKCVIGTAAFLYKKLNQRQAALKKLLTVVWTEFDRLDGRDGAGVVVFVFVFTGGEPPPLAK
jgi:hypothetical protein